MLRILSALLILTSCSMGTIESGGTKPYVYDVASDYDSKELQYLSDKIVMTSFREPPVAKLDELFRTGQQPLKRIGIVVFESEIQPTRGGLAGNDLVYMSEAGKQIMTENFLRIWEQSLKLIAPQINFVSAAEIRKSRAFHEYGLAENDYINSRRSILAPDDIFFLESGKKTTTVTTVNPRGMRDMSFMLVPAYELMGGPKWSEHNKQFLNDVSKELRLDALFVVSSQVSWTAAHTDKHSGDFIPEEIKVKLKSSILVPLHSYHKRLEKLKRQETPSVTVCYRAYEAELKVPALISVPEESKNFDTIEKEIISPMYKTYKDLTQMELIRIEHDLIKTW